MAAAMSRSGSVYTTRAKSDLIYNLPVAPISCLRWAPPVLLSGTRDRGVKLNPSFFWWIEIYACKDKKYGKGKQNTTRQICELEFARVLGAVNELIVQKKP